jgi:hypothetical protein
MRIIELLELLAPACIVPGIILIAFSIAKAFDTQSGLTKMTVKIVIGMVLVCAGLIF